MIIKMNRLHSYANLMAIYTLRGLKVRLLVDYASAVTLTKHPDGVVG